MTIPIFKSRQALVGWRGWNIIRPYFLTTNQMIWTPGERAEAFCTARWHDPDTALPVDGCTCGIYAFNAPHEVSEQSYTHQMLLGEVNLWGKVMEHERGYKAQFAYPRKLYAKTRNLYLKENRGADLSRSRDASEQWAFYEDLSMRVAAHYMVPLEFIDNTHPIYIETPAEQQRKARLEQQRRMEIAQERALTRKKNEAMRAAAQRLPPTVKGKGFKSLWEQIMAEADEEVRRRIDKKGGKKP